MSSRSAEYRIVSGPTAPPVISMLIACSIVRSVSVTRSIGRICKKRRSRVDGIRQQNRCQRRALVESVSVRVRNPMLFCPGIGKSTSTTRWLLSFFAIIVSKQLAHRRINLGHKRQPLQHRLKKVEGLPANHQRGHAALRQTAPPASAQSPAATAAMAGSSQAAGKIAAKNWTTGNPAFASELSRKLKIR